MSACRRQISSMARRRVALLKSCRADRPEVPDGTDREDHLLSGERACLQIVVTGDDLFDGQTPAPKEFCRLLVAVGHDLSGRAELVHPRCPEGKNHAVGFAQGAGSCPAGQIHFRESHFLRTVRKSSVKTVVEPEPVAAAEFFGDDLLRRGVGFEGCSERKGLNRMPEGLLVIRNRAPDSRPEMCSAKQDPNASRRFS